MTTIDAMTRRSLFSLALLPFVPKSKSKVMTARAHRCEVVICGGFHNSAELARVLGEAMSKAGLLMKQKGRP